MNSQLSKSLVSITFLFGGACASWGAMPDELNLKLRSTLTEYAKKNSLTQDELQTLLRSSVTEDVKHRKGGVGVVNKDIFVLLDDPKNTLRVSNKMWKGDPANQSEIVVTDGQRVSKSLSAIPGRNVKIIIFAPGEVRYLDPVTNTGGRYLRNRE